MRRMLLITPLIALAASCTGTSQRNGSIPSHTPSAAEVYRRVAHYLELGHVDSIADLFADTAVYRDRTFDFETRGRVAIGDVFRATVSGIGDRKMNVRRLIERDGDAVMEWTLSGTFVGSILGVPPDSMPIELEGISVGTVVAGKVVDHTDYLDRASLETRLRLRP